jgi:cytochrome c-type biogenesis protein CcmH
MPTRRRFLITLGAGIATASMARVLDAQQPMQGMNTGTANVPMDEGRYRPVRLPSRGTGPSMTDLQRDALEHKIHCQCGCNLDVFTCRTTDFTCQVSPPMHHDVMALVAGGYSGQEIINAFVGVYGERVLMEPERRGFNLAGWYMPFVALGGGTALVIALLKRWRRPAEEPASVTTLPVNATPAELSRLDQLVRHDDE